MGDFLAGGHDVGVLAIVGQAGIGKTHVWRAGLQTLDPATVHILRGRASADELAMDYVVLTDLLARIPRPIFEALPGPQRRALEVVMLRRHPSPLEPHDRHAVGLALLECVGHMCDSAPVIIAVDDAEHIDGATLATLTFAVRRLENQAVRVLLTAGCEQDIEQLVEPWHSRRSRIITLQPLPVDAFSALVGINRAEMLFPRRVSRLHGAVGGNPAAGLAILERLERYASSAGRLDRFPVPERLEDELSGILVDLPPDVIAALRVASAMSRPTLDTLAGLLGAQQTAAAIGRAVGDGVVELLDQRVRFVDPLLPSLLYHQMTGRQRLQLHRRLAASVQETGELALHNALATRHPDAAVAAFVTQTATAEQARGEHDAAAELAIEAVRLTSDREPALLHQRAELAATSLVASGDIGHAATLLEHTAGRAVPPAVRAELLLLLARLRSHTDHAAAAVHLLSLAMSEAPEPELVGRLAAELAGVWVQAGYLEEAAHELTLAQESADGPATRTVGLMLDLALGRPGDGATLVTATNADPLLPAVAQPLYAAAAIDMAAGRLEDARTTLEGLQRDSALAGDDLTAGHVMCRLSELECITGSTETALQYADTAATMARRTGQRVLLPFALARRALALGRLGRLDQARDAAQEGVAVAEATGIRRAEWLNGWALGFAALSEGDHEQAARLLVPITQASYKAGYLEPAFLRWVPDTVEALVSVGDVSLASRLLEPFAEHSARLGRTWAVALAERSHALVLGHGRARTQALAHAQQALTGYTTAADPFELARTMLVAGLLYRRQHREAEAGELLHGALELFDQLGAHTWATRLRHDLAAVPSQSRPITPVELRVAELASTGLTNRQIATQLFISPKTVESHLSSVYRKLGIRSRAGLAHKLDTLGGSPAARG